LQFLTAILDSPNKLTSAEFEIVKKHSYYTRQALQEISGFEDITEWASNHHEKLNGQGYPFGKTAEALDFNSRLIACLDIYEALTEERPYRRALNHTEAMDILNNMREEGFIDSKITRGIDNVFKI
jgi:HD-GYP domain-containing protein (c-di-GMP phosphodiesterase class II)